MKELRQYLEAIPDSYVDFVDGMINYALLDENRKKRLIRYLIDNPGSTSSEVLGFVMSFPDFYDDAELVDESQMIYA